MMYTTTARTRQSWGLLGLCVLVVVGSCDRQPTEPTEQPSRDTTPPSLTIRSPAAGAYDENGDALVDLRVEWSDSSGIDPSTAIVRSLRGASGVSNTEKNLLEYWNVTQLDTHGLQVHERKEYLLQHGQNYLEVSVRDTLGNEMRDTVSFVLPYAELTKTIKVGESLPFAHLSHGVYCADNNRIFIVVPNSKVIAVDPDSLTISGSFHSPAMIDERDIMCTPGDPYIYVTGGRVWALKQSPLGFVGEVVGSYKSRAITRSPSHPEYVYVAEDGRANVTKFTRNPRVRTGELGMPWSTWPNDFIPSMVVMPNDEKLYVSRADEGGILVVDPANGAITKRISLAPGKPDYGEADYLGLSPDSSTLYAAVTHGIPRGLARIDTRTDVITGVLRMTGSPQVFGATPDGERMFVTTMDVNGQQGKNYLVDVLSWRILQEFDRPQAPGELRFDGPVIFHPSGRWFFAGHNMNLDIYLNRK